MSLALQKTNNLKQPYWNAIVYGAPKTGKTTFLSTMPNPLIISMDEDGMQSIRHRDLDFLDITSWLELQSLLGNMEAGTKDGVFEFGGKKFNSIAFDPLNVMQSLVHKTYMQGDKPLSLPSRGASNDKLTNFVRRVCRLPIHVVFTCLERLDKDELTGRVKAGLDLSPAIMRSFPAIVSFNWHTVTEPQGGGKTLYKIATGPEGYYEAGGRYGGVHVPTRVEADFQKLYKYVNK